MRALASAEWIKEVNERYHDEVASGYDSKWGIDFGAVGQRQVRNKLRKALGALGARPFESALEIGAGTGYFTLNLLQAKLVRNATATDISPAMLRTLAANARRLGESVRTVRAEAEELPFEDQSFDLVFGHAVLHHVPDLERAFAEFHRVLRPGGVIAFCGEPSRYGDVLARLPKRGAMAAAPLWRALMRASARREADGGNGTVRDSLEWEVDVHSFTPRELRRLGQQAGFKEVRVRGEELLANLHGWTVRTLEGSAAPEEVPQRWRWFAFRSYLALQQLDTWALEPRLPASLFYNLLLSARRPRAARIPAPPRAFRPR
jgi:ubiquinone/menaquinone biosynthesis C-methylase UbiE